MTAHPPALSHAVYAALTADKNASAFAATTRLLFLTVTAASLVAIAYSDDGAASWSEASTAILSSSSAATSVTVLSYSGSLTGGSVSCATCAALPASPSATVNPAACSASCSAPLGSLVRFSDAYLLQCASTQYPTPTYCAGVSTMLGIAVFLRLLFPAVLLTLAWCAFVCGEALLRMVTATRAKAEDAPALAHFEARPQGLLPLLLANLLLLLVIVVAQPAATTTLLASLFPVASMPTYSVRVAARPGASWYIAVAALLLVAGAFYSAFRLEALGPAPGAMGKLCACFGSACRGGGSGGGGAVGSGAAGSLGPPQLPLQQHYNPAAGLPPAASARAPARAAPSPWQRLKDESGDVFVGAARAALPTPARAHSLTHPSLPLGRAGTTLTRSRT